MIRIAICDDDRNMVMQNEEIVKNTLQACEIGYEIVTYTRSSNLLSDIAEDQFFYDLIRRLSRTLSRLRFSARYRARRVP